MKGGSDCISGNGGCVRRYSLATPISSICSTVSMKGDDGMLAVVSPVM